MRRGVDESWLDDPTAPGPRRSADGATLADAGLTGGDGAAVPGERVGPESPTTIPKAVLRHRKRKAQDAR